jgi:starch-binding outer membrane protein, SusD/RagB family
MKHYIKILYSILFASVLLVSCDDILQVDSKEVLLTDDYLGINKVEARSALMGVLSQMQDVTGQYVILGELQGDLTDVRSNAELALREINMHSVTEGNIYNDPTLLFSIINNCNYSLNLMDTAVREQELLPNYVAMLRIRTWAQLQIVINYGKLPWFDAPIESNKDLNKDYPLLPLETAIDSMISALEPYVDVPNVDTYENSEGFSIFQMIPDKDVLLADLYLWGERYDLAAIFYKRFLDSYVSDGGAKYNLTSTYGVSYVQSGGVYSVQNNHWGDFFNAGTYTNEIINYIGYTDDYRQPNTAYATLVSELKASAPLILDWTLQYKYADGIAFEQGDNRADKSYLGTADDGHILKYEYSSFKYKRAAEVYLKYAEAICDAGYPGHALAVINRGVWDDATTPGAPRFTGNTESFLNFTQNKYYVLNSSGAPTSGNLGIRGRAGMAPLEVTQNIKDTVVQIMDTVLNVMVNDTITVNMTTYEDSLQEIKIHILDEAGRELAFEGKRWGDLVRFALHEGDPSILTDRVANKFESVGDVSTAESVRALLSTRDGWFLPLDIPDNFIPISANE